MTERRGAVRLVSFVPDGHRANYVAKDGSVVNASLNSQRATP